MSDPLLAFQPFHEVFRGYLPLLNLVDGSAETIVAIAEALRVTTLDAQASGISALLADNNWRPHLIAAVAILLNADPTRHLDALWSAIDRWSWVNPQLLVTASLVDARFAERAAPRLRSGRAKTAGALAVLCSDRPALAPDVAEARRRFDSKSLEHLVEWEDWCGSQKVALKWRERWCLLGLDRLAERRDPS